ncbi:MAG TPA: xylulokinase [Vicinamibacterales bacterium]|nr:xylulokinase [Vicinamibacterales bacterium]
MEGEAHIPVLGIDVGTGGSRALILDDSGALLASATAEHAPFASPRTTWAEQDPADWWRACQQAIRSAIAASGVSAESIACVGLSGQMHGAVLLDANGGVLRPSLIWCDQRTEDECRWLDDSIGRTRILELTSNTALTNFTLTKLLWVRTHEPGIWSRVRHVLLPKDYVRFQLSGEYATDVADASGTLMLDVTRRSWSDAMLDSAGIDAAILPAVFESPQICARISTTAASLTGVPAGTPIVAGAGDQAAGAIGMGITRPGAVSATIGTSGVVFAATDRPATDPEGRIHTFCHAVPGRWHVMGVTQAAGLSLKWFRDQLAAGTSYDQLTAEAGRVAPGADNVLWAPYLMGERTPHCDPNARAALLGLAASHGRGHIVRAIMEGVAFSLRDTFSIFAQLQLPVESIRLGGGGSRSALWRQIQADVYGQPVDTAVDEGAAYGAAILAAVGIGRWPTVDAACDALVRGVATTTPQPAVVAQMTERYNAYRRIYPALRKVHG